MPLKLRNGMTFYIMKLKLRKMSSKRLKFSKTSKHYKMWHFDLN